MNHQPNWKPEAPVIPAKLREDGELEEIVRQAIRTKDDMEGRRFERQPLEDVDFGVLQFTGCVFEKCVFSDWEMRRLDLVDCVFSHCEMGNLFFPAFAICKLERVEFLRSPLRESSWTECRLGRIRLEENDLSRSQWSHTPLKGADVSTCQLDGIRMTPSDLQGLRISAEQALILCGLLGVEIVR